MRRTMLHRATCVRLGRDRRRGHRNVGCGSERSSDVEFLFGHVGLRWARGDDERSAEGRVLADANVAYSSVSRRLI